jgi:quercetin dioxygenase-like cupin family protein
MLTCCACAHVRFNAAARRTELQRHDLGVPGLEVIQALVELDPGVAFRRHRHPGEEIIYVLEVARHL